MTIEWKDDDWEKCKVAARAVAGLLLGTIVLLPTAVGLLKPPYIVQWAVPTILCLSVLSLLCLGLTLMFATIRHTTPPVRLHGAGNWLAVGAIIFLFVYAFANLIFEYYLSKPVIVSLKTTPPSVEPGKFVELDVDAQNQDGAQMTYRWTFDNRDISMRKNGYLKAPEKAGIYPVQVTVSDGDRQSTAVANIEVVPQANNRPLSLPTVINWYRCDNGASHAK